MSMFNEYQDEIFDYCKTIEVSHFPRSVGEYLTAKRRSA